MLPDRVSNPGPLTYESGALPIALRGPAFNSVKHRNLCNNVESWHLRNYKAHSASSVNSFQDCIWTS